MVPYQTNDFDPRQPNASGNLAFSNFDVYSNHRDRIGTVIDGLQDAAGNLQYLVIVLTVWSPGKQVLVPINQTQVDLQNRRFYVAGLTQQQAIAAPTYNTPVATPQPQQPPQPKTVHRMRSLEDSAPLEASAPLEGYSTSSQPIPPLPPNQTVPPVVAPEPTYQAPPVPSPVAQTPVPPRQPVPQSDRSYPVSSPTQMPVDADQEAVVPLMEERVVVDHKKQKVGEVVVRKEIETEIIEVPVQREKLIVEQVGSEPRQLAEIDLTDDEFSHLTSAQRREAQLPNIPKHDP